jgi:hypothetical protein
VRRQVVRFWLAALLGPIVAAAIIRVFTDSLSPLASTLVIAAAMPAPLVAATLVGGRTSSDIVRSARAGVDRAGVTLLLPVVGAVTWVVAALLLTSALGDLLGAPERKRRTKTAEERRREEIGRRAAKLSGR